MKHFHERQFGAFLLYGVCQGLDAGGRGCGIGADVTVDVFPVFETINKNMADIVKFYDSWFSFHSPFSESHIVYKHEEPNRPSDFSYYIWRMKKKATKDRLDGHILLIQIIIDVIQHQCVQR